MGSQSRWSAARVWTVAGLVVGAVGISILWGAGQDFPVYPPPGIVVLVAGVLFVVLTRWRWTPGVGAFLGLFIVVGFLLEGIVDGEGFGNLAGDAGTGRGLGQWIQVIGALTALISGVIATRTNYKATSNQGRAQPG